MVLGYYTFSIFLRQVLLKLESLLVSCFVMRQHSEPQKNTERTLLW